MLHYGKAGQPILDYLAMLHDNANAMACIRVCFPKPEEVGLTPEVAQKSLKYFQDALALASDDHHTATRGKGVYLRVQGDGGDGRRRMELMRTGACRLFLPAELQGVSSKYVELCKTYKMSASRKAWTPLLI